MSKKVTFVLSTGFAGSKEWETFTFKQLGINNDMTQEEIEAIIEQEYEEWAASHMYEGLKVNPATSGWVIE